MRCLLAAICMAGGALCAQKLHAPDFVIGGFVMAVAFLIMTASDGGHRG